MNNYRSNIQPTLRAQGCDNGGSLDGYDGCFGPEVVWLLGGGIPPHR